MEKATPNTQPSAQHTPVHQTEAVDSQEYIVGSGTRSAADILMLQRMVGNRALQRMMQTLQRDPSDDDNSDNENDNNKKRKGGVSKDSDSKKMKTVVKGERELRQTKGREQEYIKEKMGKYGGRPGTRRHDDALKNKEQAEKELGSGKVKISSGPPYQHEGRRIYNGDRSSLSFTQEVTNNMYGALNTQVANGRTEYNVNGVWLPRLADATPLEVTNGAYASIDHVRSFADLIRDADAHRIEYDGFLWEVIYHDDARALYNDESNLEVMQQSQNSGKSGMKGVDNSGPRLLWELDTVDSEEEDSSFHKHDWDSSKDPDPDGGGLGGGGDPILA